MHAVFRGEGRRAVLEPLKRRLFLPARIVLYVGLVLLVVLLMRSMRERGGVQPGYTLRRLGVSEFAAFAWQGLAAALAVFVYFAFAAAALFSYALCYQAQGLGEAGNLSALVMLYGSRTAHALMPLADVAVYVRMAMFCLAIGLGCSYSSMLSRHGKRFFRHSFRRRGAGAGFPARSRRRGRHRAAAGTGGRWR